MTSNFRFAVVSDLHIALPHTIWNNPSRFPLVEVSIPALDSVLEHLTQLDLDFLLLPGDLTQHGEPENHTWLQQRLAKLPFPTYVIPGNHDVPVLEANSQSIAFKDFSQYYRKFGYNNGDRLYYTCELLPGVRLIALNSNNFNAQGQQVGRLDEPQLQWLKTVLAQAENELILVMIHHNVVEHLPNQSCHPMASRYMLENAPQLLQILQQHNAKLVFTGHLHIQDIAYDNGVYDITTGSLVSYPHPYRVMEFHEVRGKQCLEISSYRVESVPQFPNLLAYSRKWMGDRSTSFLVKLLSYPPLSIPIAEAEKLTPILYDFWANIASGDASFDYPNLPKEINNYFHEHSAIAPCGSPALIDNNISLLL
jgi:predicted MPP superfamily phosphohydrolase